jgi:hypothetical protein
MFEIKSRLVDIGKTPTVTFYSVNSVDMMHADMIWVQMWGLTCQRTEINGRYTLENMHNYSTTILTKQSGTLNRLFILLSTFFYLQLSTSVSFEEYSRQNAMGGNTADMVKLGLQQ